MTKEEREEAIAIIRKEYLCVDRDCDIERNCGKCDLMMPSKEPILKAYKMAISALSQPQIQEVEKKDYPFEGLDKYDLLKIDELYVMPLYQVINILLQPQGDTISRTDTLNAIIKRLGIKDESYLLEAERVIYQQILAMPPVQPDIEAIVTQYCEANDYVLVAKDVWRDMKSQPDAIRQEIELLKADGVLNMNLVLHIIDKHLQKGESE